MNLKRKATSPWAWTLAVAGLSALLVAAAGVILAKRVERIAEKPSGNRVDDCFRETVRRIGVMEGLWQVAVEGEAKRMLLSNGRDRNPSATGVVQCSWLNPGFSDPGRAHRRADGRDATLKPVLERFAKREPGEWVLNENEVLHGADWLETPGRPLAWRQGNGRAAVLLLLDPIAAAATVERDVLKRPSLKFPENEPGTLIWNGPGGKPYLTKGNPEPDAKPDEVLRHVSRFGDWTLQRFYPVRVVTSYRTPVLAGSFTLAALLLGGGIAVASWQRKAIRLAEERVSFVNRVSHELRTPLTNLLINTDLALDGLSVEDGKVRRRLGLIREETSRLSRIVDNVLAFARIEREQGEPHQSTCDVDRIIAELRENFAPLFERKSIVCQYENHVSNPVLIDRDAFSQILSNLLSNVEKYAGESSQARVSLTETQGKFVVEVEDNGPGIPATAHKRVFMPFERAGSRVDEGASGTGLGLAISRELAQRMGGRLELEPCRQGAKFRLVIPLRERRNA